MTARRDPELALRIEAIVHEHAGDAIDRAHLRADLRDLIAWDRERRPVMSDQGAERT